MDLPPDGRIRWIARSAARLLELGAEPVRGLVLPTAEFFPDKFDGSPKSVAALFGRVLEHAGLEVETELAFFSPEEEPGGGGCSTGACGPGGKLGGGFPRAARREDGSYLVTIAVGEVRQPVVLTTALVRATAFIFLAESEAIAEIRPRELEPTIDLTAVLLGFGVLVANGSYIYMKGCGGVQVHSATVMPPDETTLALALFCKLHGIAPRMAARHLEVTPRAHFDEAATWAESNAGLVKLVRTDAASLESDAFAVAEPTSWLARTLGLGKRSGARIASDEDLAALERELGEKRGKRAVDPAKAKTLAEIRALVDESLEG